MNCPHCEKEIEDDGVDLPDEGLNLTRADILPIMFCIWLAFNVVFAFFGLIGGSTAAHARYEPPTQWHAEARADQCDLLGKWNYVLIGYTGGCRFSRWMAE